MDSSSKYADLPFIAKIGSDVYETGISSEPASLAQPAPDASIEIIPSGTMEAFQRFQNCIINQNFNLEVEPIRENAVAKYNRIKNEIDELKALIEDPDQDEDKLDLNIEELENNLANLRLLTTGKSGLSSKVVANDISSSLQQKQSKTQDSEAIDGLVRYDLFCKPNQDQLIEASKLNSYEQRIKKLENYLGIEKPATFVTANLKDEPLMNVVAHLSNKAAVLDHGSLDKVEARLNVILDKLEQIGHKKEELESLHKLNELYDQYVKSTGHSKRLPAILERLQVLSEVQKQATDFSATVSEFQDAQSAITNSLDNTKGSLKLMREMFEQKTQAIQLIFDDYNARLEKLK